MDPPSNPFLHAAKHAYLLLFNPGEQLLHAG